MSFLLIAFEYPSIAVADIPVGVTVNTLSTRVATH